MAKQNSVNLDITNNADGFSISGGVTGRTFGISGGDVTLVGSGNATVTFPTTSTTIAGLGIAQTFTALQTFNAGVTTTNIYASSGVTFASISAYNGLASFNAGLSATSGCSFNTATVYIVNSGNVDPLYVQHASANALKVATTGQARSGSIRLGNSATSTQNTVISQTDGTLTIYNGLSTTGGNILSLSSNVLNVGVTVSGLTLNALLRSTAGISAALGICGGTFMSAEGGYRVTSSAIKTLTGTTYTLLVGDDGKILTTSNASLQKFEIPTGLPVGFNCSVLQLGTGPVGFSAASSVTLNTFAGKTLMAGQYAAVSIIEYATNTVSISGGLTT